MEPWAPGFGSVIAAVEVGELSPASMAVLTALWREPVSSTSQSRMSALGAPLGGSLTITPCNVDNSNVSFNVTLGLAM